MAKLNQLRTLEQMLRTYDSMNVDDKRVIQLQGMCVEGLVDDITKRLDRLRESKTRLSCRNVLVANYETMTDARHWLGSRLFSDLPKEESKVLKEKMELMVYLMTALMLKIMDVDADYADTFFCKLKESYKRKRITNYELWKAQLPEVTMELLTRFQTELTADMLAMGVLKYDLKPSHEEVEQVQLEKVLRKLPHDKKYPEDFTEECAKLRRYSHWDGEQFCVDYQLLRKYMFQHFGEMTSEQHVALFEYDVQMRMIHEDMKRMKEEPTQRPTQKPTQQPTPSPSQKGGEISLLPESLATEEAMALWRKAQKAGYVDENYQPTISRTQAAMLADAMAERLKIKDKWKVFEALWQRKYMRSDYNLAFTRKSTLDFQDELKRLFG